MIHPARSTIQRENFEIDPYSVLHQQDLLEFFTNFLEGKDNELLAGDAEGQYTKREILERAAARMALHSCQVVTLWEYLRAGQYLKGVTINEFISTVWAAYDTRRAAWYRAPLTREIKKSYGIPIISAGVKWLNEDMTLTDEELMIHAGYCSNAADIEAYKLFLHGKDLSSIIAERPAVITISNTVGNNGPHAVLAWDIQEGMLEYLSVDGRDIPQYAGLCRAPLDILESDTALNGALTIILPS